MGTLNYFLNIGTNIGDRMANVDHAVALIERSFGCAVRRSSPFYSAPWGFVSPNRFVNVGLLLPTAETPENTLRMLHAVEESMGSASHRNADGSYADRIIDIDIIAIDDLVISSESRVVPHPRMTERDFVLAPMAEIAPRWRHPLTGLTAAEMLAALAAR